MSKFKFSLNNINGDSYMTENSKIKIFKAFTPILNKTIRIYSELTIYNKHIRKTFLLELKNIIELMQKYSVENKYKYLRLLEEKSKALFKVNFTCDYWEDLVEEQRYEARAKHLLNEVIIDIIYGCNEQNSELELCNIQECIDYYNSEINKVCKYLEIHKILNRD